LSFTDKYCPKYFCTGTYLTGFSISLWQVVLRKYPLLTINCNQVPDAGKEAENTHQTTATQLLTMMRRFAVSISCGFAIVIESYFHLLKPKKILYLAQKMVEEFMDPFRTACFR
jgi:hypothetical protein